MKQASFRIEQHLYEPLRERGVSAFVRLCLKDMEKKPQAVLEQLSYRTGSRYTEGWAQTRRAVCAHVENHHLEPLNGLARQTGLGKDFLLNLAIERRLREEAEP